MQICYNFGADITEPTKPDTSGWEEDKTDPLDGEGDTGGDGEDVPENDLDEGDPDFFAWDDDWSPHDDEPTWGEGGYGYVDPIPVDANFTELYTELYNLVNSGLLDEWELYGEADAVLVRGDENNLDVLRQYIQKAKDHIDSFPTMDGDAPDPEKPPPTPTKPDPTPTKPDPTPTKPDPTPTKPDPTPTDTVVEIHNTMYPNNEVALTEFEKYLRDEHMDDYLELLEDPTKLGEIQQSYAQDDEGNIIMGGGDEKLEEELGLPDEIEAVRDPKGNIVTMYNAFAVQPTYEDSHQNW